ncbi:hypothetical protein Hanom_Chr01g00027511 [Helianthus anomalus]
MSICHMSCICFLKCFVMYGKMVSFVLYTDHAILLMMCVSPVLVGLVFLDMLFSLVAGYVVCVCLVMRSICGGFFVLNVVKLSLFYTRYVCLSILLFV